MTGGRRVIKHMMNGRLSKGWNAWVEETALQTWKMQMLLKTTAFLRNSKLPAGWNTWLELVQEREGQRRGLAYFMHRELARGFLGWHAQWWDAERNREVMLYAWGHMCNRELSTALNAWAEMIEMRAEFMQLVRKGLGFMMNRKVAMAMASWREFWQDQMRKRESMGASARHGPHPAAEGGGGAAASRR